MRRSAYQALHETENGEVRGEGCHLSPGDAKKKKKRARSRCTSHLSHNHSAVDYMGTDNVLFHSARDTYYLFDPFRVPRIALHCL